MKEKAEPIIFISILAYLCCYFLQLFKFPNILMLGIGACFCLVLLLKQKRIRISLGLCLMAVTMFSFCIIQFGIRAIVSMMPYVILVMWVLADYLGAEFKGRTDGESKMIYILYSMILGHMIYGVLNAYMYFAGTGVPGTRYWFDIWSQQLTPGTQLTMYFISTFAVFLPAVLFFFKRKWANIILIIGTGFFIYASLATKTRTTLLVLAIVFCIQALLYVVLEREKILSRISVKKIIIAAVIILAVAILGIILVKDTQIVKEFIDNLGKGGGILNNARFVVQRKALAQLFDYPMGGRQMDLGFIYCHNVWLDMANAAGLIPFIAFTVFTVYTLYYLIRFIMKKVIQTETKLVMTGMYVAFFLYYTVEPALDASVHFLTPWMLINGLIHGYLAKEGK